MTIWRTLFWKEFHEHKWKVLSLTTIVLSVILVEIMQADVEAGLILAVYGYMLAAPIYIAMGVTSGEQGSRSIAFVRALPNPTWHAGFARVVVGWLVLVTPLIAALLVCELNLALNPDSAKQYEGMLASQGAKSAQSVVLTIIGVSVGMATNLYAWILFTTMNQKSELRAGLIGLLTVVALFSVGTFATHHVNVNAHADPQTNHNAAKLDFSWLTMAAGPLLWIQLTESRLQVWMAAIWLPSLAIQVLTFMLLLTCAASCYGGRTLIGLRGWTGTRDVDQPANLTLRPPLASPQKALLWMQLRESVPIAMCGLALMLMLAGLEGQASRLRLIQDIGTFVGCILAVIIAVGAFVPQLESKLHTFWRSRPISPRQWFWMKYAAGALVIVVCFDLPLAFLQSITTTELGQINPYLAHFSYISHAGFPILLHLFIYSFVVLASCGVRHPIYSGIIGIAAVLFILLPPETFNGIPDAFSFFGKWRDSRYQSDTLLHAIFLLGPLIVGSAWSSAWLIRKDISVSH